MLNLSYLKEVPEFGIFHNGNRVVLTSGKSVWNSVRAAKSALTLQIKRDTHSFPTYNLKEWEELLEHNRIQQNSMIIRNSNNKMFYYFEKGELVQEFHTAKALYTYLFDLLEIREIV